MFHGKFGSLKKKNHKNIFWKNKNILITGHTGFKGSWLSIILDSLGARVSGISLKPNNFPNLYNAVELERFCKSYICNIMHFQKVKKIFNEVEPEVIFHLAAQPIVLESYKEPIKTLNTNIIGTANILEISRNIKSLKVLIIVTTDKVYKIQKNINYYKEDDSLGGEDIYSASKTACEIVVNAYRHSFLNQNVALSTVRAGNIIGGGDWSSYRLIPDLVKSTYNDKYTNIRNPDAIRPWQHILDPLFGYIKLAKKMYYEPKLTEAFNFGPENKKLFTVRNIIEIAKTFNPKIKVKYLKKYSGPKETNFLSLNIEKSKKLLSFKPLLDTEVAIEKTINWYDNFYKNNDQALSLCLSDIEFYQKLLDKNK